MADISNRLTVPGVILKCHGGPRCPQSNQAGFVFSEFWLLVQICRPWTLIECIILNGQGIDYSVQWGSCSFTKPCNKQVLPMSLCPGLETGSKMSPSLLFPAANWRCFPREQTSPLLHEVGIIPFAFCLLK